MAIDHVLLLVIMFLKNQLKRSINFNLFITNAFDLVQVLLRYINYN